MGSIRPFNPVKLFVGVLVSDVRWIPQVQERLVLNYGPIDHQSGIIQFHFTNYYQKEMGDGIERVFFAFERLIEADRLPEIKRRTNRLEEEFASLEEASVKRPVNLDPGYIEHAKVVLASTKNFYHRMYLGDGIFGEVTLHFKDNGFQFFPWTYPDYQSSEYLGFFKVARNIYRQQLRSACLLNREERQ
jgi:uncharacterized protein DUF4416